MPETAERARERKAAARQADRRRRAATVLRISAAACTHASVEIGNGLSPQQARTVVLDAAAELEAAAASLRRLVRLDGPERRRLAAQLAASGIGTRQISRTIGVSDRAVRWYVRGRACP